MFGCSHCALDNRDRTAVLAWVQAQARLRDRRRAHRAPTSLLLLLLLLLSAALRWLPYPPRSTAR